ncbi:MAG: F0F1 ATP synthase subunit A [Bradymonadaceae bacterium]|nr:F0F1 ATP synthase subunit A [Lujinxingiaceae bacterium]
MADYTFVDLVPAIAEREHGIGWNEVLFFGNPLLNASGKVTITHLIMTGLLVVVIVLLTLIARRKYRTREEALIPGGSFSVTNFFEIIFEAILKMMSDMMGEKAAKRYFPLIASLAVFIFFGNLMGLVPGLAPPTANLNTGLACGLVVFVVYNVGGFWESGFAYIKHFFGPVLFVAPLIFAIELVGHAFRPISLSIRLGGNMTGDHMVIGVFGDLAAAIAGMPFLLPVPFLFLGLLVSTIQALVFSLLSTIYIALAVHHEEGH